MEHEAETSTRRSWSPWLPAFAVSVALLIAVVSFGVGMLAERILFAGGSLFERARELGGLETPAEPDVAAAFPLLDEVRDLIEEEYYFRPASPEARPAFRARLKQNAASGMATAAAQATPVAAVDDLLRQLEYGALTGMTEALDDDYSIFLEPAEQAPLAEQIEGEYQGIGVIVRAPEGVLTVETTIPGSPAEAAGLLAGDVLEAADGHPLTGLEHSQALALIRGPEGSTVRLTIRRAETPDPIAVDVERRAVPLPSVYYYPVADGGVARIQIVLFGDKTTGELDAALKRAREEGVAGIVLDLRGNGGGWVTSAREVIGRFVPSDRGPALYEDDGPGENTELREASILGGGESTFDLPLVVLVDGGTASAAEIVAGALADYGRAPLIGTRTFGKGEVQQVRDFADGSSVRITSAMWLTPDKAPIPDEGLLPDEVVETGDAVEPEGVDSQLARAIEVVLGG